jgi:GT2 family glycosyltransferase
MGAVMLVRRAAIDDVGLLDEDFFLFSEETDWHYRFRRGGWKVVFTPDAEAVHVGGAAHGGRLFVEQVRGHLRFLAKHRGVPTAARARRLLLVALRLRGILFRGERGRRYRDAAGWLAAGTVTSLLDPSRGRPERPDRSR